MHSYQKVVIKIGTNVLTTADGRPDLTTISHLVDQMARLRQEGVQVILVSSGAVGAGRSVLPNLNSTNKVVRRQVLSAVGQIRLMQIYQTFFSNHGLVCAQVLATKEDFRDRQHYLNMKQCFMALEQDQLIPIVNENDVISISELMFTDNDELAGWVATMVNADALLILTNVDGIFDRHPDEPTARRLEVVDPDDKAIDEMIGPAKSSFGRGGMHTKLGTARKVAKVGIPTFIINGKQPNILLAVQEGQQVGTQVLPQHKVSNVKKWLAFTETERSAGVALNAGAVEALCDKNKVSSLLPVGIIEVIGLFKKGDLICLYDENGNLIGSGLAQYGAEKATQFLGKKDKKPLVHYDYLHIEAI